jgi:hypothetical protein
MTEAGGDNRGTIAGQDNWERGLMQIANLLWYFDARGESRTRTRLPSADFESAASAIPPLGPRLKFR